MKKIMICLLAAPMFFISCKKEGCMDQSAVNYDSEAGKEGPCNYVPTITVNGNNPDTVEVGSTYVDAGATATNADGSAATLTVDTSQVNTGTAGSFVVTYTASNEHGSVTATRDVAVVIGQGAWLGSWTITDDCDDIQFPLEANPTIAAGGNANEITIDPMFLLAGGTAVCSIDGQNITIPQTSVNITLGDIIFDGTGTINSSGNQIVITYNYENTAPGIGGLGTCTATYSK